MGARKPDKTSKRDRNILWSTVGRDELGRNTKSLAKARSDCSCQVRVWAIADRSGDSHDVLEINAVGHYDRYEIETGESTGDEQIDAFRNAAVEQVILNPDCRSPAELGSDRKASFAAGPSDSLKPLIKTRRRVTNGDYHIGTFFNGQRSWRHCTVCS